MQETIVRLKVRSPTFTPDQITAVISIPCDARWCIGDTRPHTTIREKDNGWVLGSGLPKDVALEEHIDALLHVLNSRADSIRSLSAVAKVEFSCVIYAEATPALNFDASVINRIARLGAALDIDLYRIECDDSK